MSATSTMFDPALASNRRATASSIGLSGATEHPGSASNAVAVETGAGAAWVPTFLDSNSDLNKFCAGSHSKSSHDAGADWCAALNSVIAGFCVGAATRSKATKALKSTKEITPTNRKELCNQRSPVVGLHSIGRLTDILVARSLTHRLGNKRRRSMPAVKDDRSSARAGRRFPRS
jgi:hypothetical protein